MMTIGGGCSLIVSMGTCPLGMFCGVVPILIVPIGIAELCLGLVMFEENKNGLGPHTEFALGVPLKVNQISLIGVINKHWRKIWSEISL